MEHRRRFASSICAIAIASLLLVQNGRSETTPTTPAVGTTAPDFELKQLDGKTAKLSELYTQGPVVLVVLRGWPGYQCPLCTKQVADLVAHAKQFETAGAKVVLIYPGPAKDLDAHAAEFFKDKSSSDGFVTLVDPDFTFVNAYALRWEKAQETAYPSTFVIDHQGVVRFRKMSKTHGDRASAATILAELAKLK